MNNSIISHKHLSYRPDIDGLRAVAVLLVVIYHAFPSLIPGGFIGVDIFFVISGFLITSIILKDLERGVFKFSDFYFRRINRIFPSLIVVLAFSFFIGWIVYLPTEFEQLSKHIVGGSFFVSNLILLGESGYFDVAAESKPLLHLWSLGIEEQFYIFWPLLLWVVYNIRSGVISAVCLLMVVSFFCNVLFINSEPEFTFYSPITRFWELAIGAFLAVTINCKSESKLLSIAKNVTSWISKSKVRSDVCSLFGSALLMLAVLITSKSEQFPGWYALLPTFGTFLIILAGPHANVNKYFLSSKLMVWIGLVSFPLYLWHWPVFVFAKAHLGQVLSAEIQLILVIVSFILAFITFQFVERPLRFSSSKKSTAFKLLTVIACISLVSVYIFNKNGLASRFPPMVQNIINHADVDATIHWRVGTCHLLPRQDYNSFSACESEPKDSTGKPTLLVWGDSHAAHLYPGLFKNLSKRYRIIQKTASTCPPIFDVDIPVSPNCVGINDEMRKFIINERPDRIMLAAAWDVYDWNQLSSTIAWLKDIEIRHIDLVGPVPRWLDSLPRQLLVYFMSNGQKQIPVRMINGLKPYVMSLDHDMSQFAKEHNINYLSPTQILCNADGCLTRVGKENMSITAFDSSHLTEDGAKYVASQFKLKN